MDVFFAGDTCLCDPDLVLILLLESIDQLREAFLLLVHGLALSMEVFPVWFSDVLSDFLWSFDMDLTV